jgi:hypothetical protein
MPFRSKEQEIALKHKAPDVYRRWMRKYGPYRGGLVSAVKEADRGRRR